MATFQSQIDILAKAIIHMSNSIQTFPKFKLIKLNSTIEDTNNIIPQFQKNTTYLLGLDTKKTDLDICTYNVELAKNTSTISNNKYKNISFDYYTPTTYTLDLEASTEWFGDNIHTTIPISATNKDEVTILFNFSDIIPALDPTNISANIQSSKLTPSTSYEIGDDDNSETITQIIESSDTDTEAAKLSLRKNENFENTLNKIIEFNEKECIDLVNEYFQSILYSNVYELSKNNKINFKEFQNSKHKNKKQLDLNDLKNKYILECVNNKIYYFM